MQLGKVWVSRAGGCPETLQGNIYNIPPCSPESNAWESIYKRWKDVRLNDSGKGVGEIW